MEHTLKLLHLEMDEDEAFELIDPLLNEQEERSL
jgi:hypothetical protein